MSTTSDKVVYQISLKGSIIAMIISWSVNKSIAWTILHGIFGWFYVIYYAVNN